jgi:cyclohexyl-isocyanide hydratase
VTTPEDGPTTSAHDMTAMPDYPTGTEKIAMLMYPQMTAIDLVGPQYFLSSLFGATVYLVAKEMTPVHQ